MWWKWPTSHNSATRPKTRRARHGECGPTAAFDALRLTAERIATVGCVGWPLHTGSGTPRYSRLGVGRPYDGNATTLDELTSTAALPQRWRVTCCHGATGWVPTGSCSCSPLWRGVAAGCAAQWSLKWPHALRDGLHRAMRHTKTRVCAVSAEHMRQRLRRATRPIPIVRISEASVRRRLR